MSARDTRANFQPLAPPDGVGGVAGSKWLEVREITDISSLSGYLHA
jgi:hypothetical protein